MLVQNIFRPFNEPFKIVGKIEYLAVKGIFAVSIFAPVVPGRVMVPDNPACRLQPADAVKKQLSTFTVPFGILHLEFKDFNFLCRPNECR